MLIGERLNSQGSRKMKELLLADDYDRMLELAHEQVNSGAHTLDVCVALTERADEAAQMRRLVKRLSQSIEAPLVIDTTEADVVAAALKTAPGRVIVNAINMENGRQRIDAVVPLVKAHGAAVIALTIDEAGMAKTAERKLEVARAIYDIVVGEYGLLPDALIFDDLTFTLATGDAEFTNSAVETIEGIAPDQGRACRACSPRWASAMYPLASSRPPAPSSTACSSIHCVARRPRHGHRQPQAHHALRRNPGRAARAGRRPDLQPPAGRPGALYQLLRGRQAPNGGSG